MDDLSPEDLLAYEQWAYTPYTGPLHNFKQATLNSWKAARDYYQNKPQPLTKG